MSHIGNTKINDVNINKNIIPNNEYELPKIIAAGVIIMHVRVHINSKSVLPDEIVKLPMVFLDAKKIMYKQKALTNGTNSI